MSDVNDDWAGRPDPSDGIDVPDGDDDTVVCRRVGDSERLSETILSTLVSLGDAAAGATPLERQEPLYETLDVRALDELFTGGDGSGVVVQFPYDGYVLTVCEAGIRVDAADGDDGR